MPESKSRREFLSGATYDEFKSVSETLPKAQNFDRCHYEEWIAACKGGRPGYSNFDIAAYLTEIMLLGCVALRAGKKIEWDGPAMKAKNSPEAAQFVKRHYRHGYSL